MLAFPGFVLCLEQCEQDIDPELFPVRILVAVSRQGLKSRFVDALIQLPACGIELFEGAVVELAQLFANDRIKSIFFPPEKLY